MANQIPRHVVWSTDQIDLDDPFQRVWLMRQVLLHGLSEDIRQLDLDEVEQNLEALDLPPDLHRLWKDYLESRHERS